MEQKGGDEMSFDLQAKVKVNLSVIYLKAMAACPFLGSQRNFLLSKSFLRTSHSRKVGWKNMRVSSARRTRKPERDEKRIKNSPHCSGTSTLASALTEL